MGKLTKLVDSVRLRVPDWVQLRRGGSSKPKRGSSRLLIEGLEERLVLDNCGCDPAVLALVPDAAVTAMAIRPGLWSSPYTWREGHAPTANANVLIPLGVAVLVDNVFVAPLHTIRLDGTLIFSPHSNTGLSVDTLVVNGPGTLTIGTAAAPIDGAHTATLTFTDSAPINTSWDPQQLSRGLLSLGTVSMYGSKRTAFVALAQAPKKGDTTLVLAKLPTNWNVGDQLLLPGTSGDYNQDEIVTLRAMSGSLVTVTPLVCDHLVPAAGLSTYVADMTRNVEIESANPSDIAGRGHTMFMSAATDLEGAAFCDLGRTNKAVPLNDPVFDSTGKLIAGTGTNPRGRYSIHFHEVGTDKTTQPAEARDCVVMGSPGWGYVNHSSYVNFDNNISYNVFGAGFVAEAGDEIGALRGNLAVREVGSGEAVDSRSAIQDWGHNGVGFWYQGYGVLSQNNIAAGAAGAGFQWYGKGLIKPDGTEIQFAAANLPDPSLANGQLSVSVESVPLGVFSGNVAFADTYAIWIDYLQAHPLAANERSVVDNFTVWNLSGGRSAMMIHYSSHLTVQNSWLVGNISQGGIGIQEGNEATTDNMYLNDRIERWSVGLYTAQAGTDVITGGYFNNIVNIDIPAQYAADGQAVAINNVQFGMLPATQLVGKQQYNVEKTIDFATLLQNYGPGGIFAPNLVTYNGQQVYAPEQAANFVPFTTAASSPGVPAALIGLTNQQLWDQFGLAVGGALAPAQAATLPGIRGTVGLAANYLPSVTLVSPTQADHTKPYQLVYNLGNQGVVDPNPVALQAGWNLITRTIAGRTRSFFVYGT
jgi:hypothetical protein